MAKRSLRNPSLTLFTIRGIPVRVQLTFVLMPLWAAFIGWQIDPRPVRGAIFMATFMLLLFALAMVHELGHIIPARRFGATICGVRVSSMGAFVQVESKSEMRPAQNLVIALGGLVVSAVLTALLALLAWQGLRPGEIAEWPRLLFRPGGVAVLMLILLAGTNAALTLFNLLPFFPMDGGRALSAGLALFVAPDQATRLVSTFGQIVAIAALPMILLLPSDFLFKLAVLLTAGLVFLVGLRARKTAPGAAHAT
jgi:Zn-dependent protease